MTITRNVISLENFKASLFSALPFWKSEIETSADEIYNRAIAMIERYVPEDSPFKNIQVTFGSFRDTGGHQLIAEGAVSDLGKPVQNTYNWHLQNTSQWLFAFGLVFDKERLEFSIHT